MTDYADWLRILWTGMQVTIEVTVASSIIAVIVGLAAAILSISPSRGIAAIGRNYIDVVRSVPILVLLTFGYHGLGALVGGLPVFLVSTIVLGFSTSAYIGDVYRGVLLSVSKKQWEAGHSLGMRRSTVLRQVVLPQLYKPAIPSTINMIISVIKNSALASLITLPEVTLRAGLLASQTFRTLEVYLLLAGMYVAIILPLAMVGKRLELRLSASA